MIYIWDNGQDYDDHRIGFIESDFPRAAVGPVLWAREPYGFLLGVAPAIEWRKGKAEPLQEFVDSLHCADWQWNGPYRLMENRQFISTSAVWQACSPDVRRYLLKTWPPVVSFREELSHHVDDPVVMPTKQPLAPTSLAELLADLPPSDGRGLAAWLPPRGAPFMGANAKAAGA